MKYTKKSPANQRDSRTSTNRFNQYNEYITYPADNQDVLDYVWRSEK
jgi:hypothetical protein